MKIQHSSDQLVLCDSPGCFWLFGLFFVIIGGLFVLGPLGLFSNRAEYPLWQNLLAFGMGWCGIAAGIYVWHGAPFTTVVFDRRHAQVDVEQRWLFIRSGKMYHWGDIAAILLANSKDSDGDPVYRIEMRLYSGGQVPLFALWLQSKTEYENAIRAIENLGISRTIEFR